MDEAGPEQLPWVCGGRLRTRGNSGRPGGPDDGYRRDSSGIFDKFLIQRSSGFGLEALRLPRLPGRPGAWSFHPRPQMLAAHPRQLLRAGFWLLRAGERSEKMLSDELLHNVHLKRGENSKFQKYIVKFT